jgi:uracil-DNA glycosylase family 4
MTPQLTKKQAQLDAIKARIVKDKITPELAKTAKKMVFGEGSPNADIVFIGEAPGKSEDETGRPFVGAAGKFLEEMLNTIGYARKDVYITSILKYRPPNNRDPLPDEKKAFLTYR